MLVEHFNDWQRYNFGPEWNAVLTWLEAAWHQTAGQQGLTAGQLTAPSSSLNPDLSTGTHHVDGCTINLMSTETRLQEGCRYEVHRKFCDVQMVLEGQEWLFNASTQGLELDGTFDEVRDIGFYATAPAETVRLTLRPGMFALLFPWDAHMPAIAVDNNPAPLRKCVAKIPLDALTLGCCNIKTP